MSWYWLGTVKKTQIGEFVCGHCGWKGRARVIAVGVGTTSYLSEGSDTALAKAELDVAKDAKRQISLARCRRCGQRSRGAALIYALPYGLGSLACLWLGSVLWPFVLWPVGLVAIPWYARRQWKQLDNQVEWLASPRSVG